MQEEVQLPVHFFLDTAMEDDPKMDHVDHITLSYTFFEVEHEYADEPTPATHASPAADSTAPLSLPPTVAAPLAAAAKA